MGDEEDYLSDKFLVEQSSSSSIKTYGERRKEAQRLAKLKNDQNRVKSRRQRELESRQEGLKTSLFDRAKEEDGQGGNSKALSIMMKMGFRPGQALGMGEEPEQVPSPGLPSTSKSSDELGDADTAAPTSVEPQTTSENRKAEPIPILEWGGKMGIGSRKRSPSPTSAARVAKMAKMEERASHQTFRDRTREGYEERRAEGRLRAAQRTCAALDEKAGKSFNVLWLVPDEIESFPDGLINALDEHSGTSFLSRMGSDHRGNHGIESRLRRQMRADALQPLSSETGDAPSRQTPGPYPPELIDEALQFLRLNARDRLQIVLDYLRNTYAYCFWCGTQYGSTTEMDEQCPGEDEDAHD